MKINWILKIDKICPIKVRNFWKITIVGKYTKLQIAKATSSWTFDWVVSLYFFLFLKTDVKRLDKITVGLG